MSLEEDEQNKAEFLHFFEVVWSGRLPGDEEWMGEILTAFPDLKATPDRVLAAEGGHVVIMFTVTATHQGDYRGVPATGEPITFKEARSLRWRTGRSSMSSSSRRRWVP